MPKNFSKLAYQKAYVPWHDSFEHPFITELQAGTLEPSIFRFYLLQDRYYLEHFSKLYRLIAENTDSSNLKSALIAGSQSLSEGELAIRKGFFNELSITETEIATTPIAPTAYNYVSHMYRQLYTGNPTIAAASMLPCEWLYQEIGEHLSTKHSPVPIYQRWIDSYATIEAKEAVNKQRALLDDLYLKCSTEEQNKMITAFYISSKMEYNFWEMAYNKEIW